MQKIKQAIAKFSNNDSLVDATKDFFSALNIPYQVISTADYKATDFFEKTDKYNDKITKINTVALIDEKALNNQFEELDSNTLRFADKYDAIGVFAVELLESNPTRTTLVEITRAINREMEAFPVAVIFKYDNFIALASTERTTYISSNRSGEKVGKVSIIRDIDTLNTHPGHLQILQELSIQRTGTKAIKTFDELYKYWYSVFNVTLLNKKFYQELSNWYFWALREVKFPNAPNQFELGLDDEKFDEKLKEHNGKNVIRLLTRILFVWFIKEKGLIPEEIFDEKVIADRFIDGFTPEKPESSFATGKHTSKYYRAIIQNLFFATLNQPQGKREFRNKENRQHHNVTQLMRYQEYIKDPEFFIQLMEDKVPFMNGGLFECLDKPHPTLKGPQGGERIIYVDGFSDRTDNEVEVPDYLFFDKEEELDLSSDYGDKKRKKEITRGLITILKNYKFTITENTPIEEEVALDPELLGKVFENLLASYNPETKSSARKQTGSFYTPREIVNYMVEESLIAYLKNKLDDDTIEEDIRELVSFSSINPFEGDAKTKNEIIKALDECTILDPACGSGAYPMGILQKMVHILHKIDPKNEEWKQRQLEKVNKALEDIEEISDETIREKITKELKEQIKDIEESFESNELDYGRKLYLIENCIYGVDIQPIATQISKLRFFISLVVDQKVDATKENFGIRPLPNLETKFVAANTLIGLDKSSNLFDLPEIKVIEKQLKKVRHELFAAKTKKTKNEKRQLDKELRNQIASKLEENGFGTDIAQKLADWDPFDQNTSSDFFDKEWMFDKTDGFDIVIGNPPYLIIPKKLLNELYKDFILQEGKPDLYRLFLEKSFHLLSSIGVFSFITPNTFLTIPNSNKLRKSILKNYHIESLLNFDETVFESASVNSLVFVFNRTSNNRKTKISIINSNNTSTPNIDYFISQKDWEQNPQFEFNIFINDESSSIISEIENNSKKMSDLGFSVTLGAQQYHNTIHTEEQIKKRFLHSVTKLNNNYIQELGGKNINLFKIDFPLNASYVDFSADFYTKPDLSYFTKPRVIFREITGKTIISGYTESPFIISKSCYSIVGKPNKLKNLQLIISSQLVGFWVLSIGDKSKQRLFPRITKSAINKIPIKLFDNDTFAVNLHDIIAHSSDSSLFKLFREIQNALVFNLYFPDHLKEREIDVLEVLERDIDGVIQGREFEKLSDAEKEMVIEALYAKWSHPDNEVRNRIKLFAVRSPEILKPILES